MKIDDSQWQELAPLLLGKHSDPGANARNNRLFIDAMLWVISQQASWSRLPSDFGKMEELQIKLDNVDAGSRKFEK